MRRDLPQRKTLRMPACDYATPAWYFVTIVTQGRARLLSDIVAGEARLTDVGRLVAGVWRELPTRFPAVELGAVVIMPDHVHALLGIGTREGPALREPAWLPALPAIVRTLKATSAKRINRLRGTRGAAVWQRSYYERLVRSERQRDAIREYIESNPARWRPDETLPFN